MSVKKTSTILYTWTYTKIRYRLVEIGDHQPGFRDKLVLESCGLDAAGDDRWNQETSWRKGVSDEEMQLPLFAAAIDELKARIAAMADAICLAKTPEECGDRGRRGRLPEHES
jgi:hypothetical protein